MFMTWLLFVLIMQAKYYAQNTGNQCSILGRSNLRVLQFPQPIKLTATIYLKYSGVRHHKPSNPPLCIIMVIDNELFTINISGLSMNMTKHFYFGLFSAEYANLILLWINLILKISETICTWTKLYHIWLG